MGEIEEIVGWDEFRDRPTRIKVLVVELDDSAHYPYYRGDYGYVNLNDVSAVIPMGVPMGTGESRRVYRLSLRSGGHFLIGGKPEDIAATFGPRS